MVARWAQRLWPLLVIAALLAGIAVLAQLGHATVHSVAPTAHALNHPDPAQSASAPPSALPQIVTINLNAQHKTPQWVIKALLFFVVAFVSIVFVLGVAYVITTWWPTFRIRQRSLGDLDATAMSRRQQVIAAVDETILELAREDGDARSAVIACWVRLEEVAEIAGTPREPGDTPSDLVTRLLGAHQVSVGTLTSLAELYRTARYSTREIAESMRSDARSALGQLRDELARSRSGPLADEPALDDRRFAPRPRPASPSSEAGEPR